jgi:hypothetical protein
MALIAGVGLEQPLASHRVSRHGPCLLACCRGTEDGMHCDYL